MSRWIVIGLGALALFIAPSVGWAGAGYSITPLPGLNGDSGANAINGQGMVVGGFGPGTFSPFVWSPSTGMRDLGVPAGYTSASAVAVNSSGQVAVRAINPLPGGQSFVTRAFRWDSGVYTDLGTLGGTLSEPHGIDDSGRVAGFAYTDKR